MGMDTNRVNKNKWIRLFVCLIFFLTLFLVFGVRSDFPDTDEYTGMSIQVSAGYPLFLLLNKKIFGTGFLSAAVVIQNLLAAFSVWHIVEQTGTLLKCAEWVKNLGIVIFIAPFIGTTFLSNSGMVLSCSILTEGITLPLYYLLLAYLIKTMFKPEVRTYISLGLVAGCLIITRSQMMISCLLVLIICSIKSIKIKKIWYCILQAVLALCIYFGANAFYKANSEGSVNTLNKATILTNLMCSSTEEDALLFEGEERVIYERIIEKLEENDYLVKDANPIQRAVRIENVHDYAKNGVIYSVMYEHLIYECGITDYEKQSVAIDAYLDEFMRKLFFNHPGIAVYNTFCLGIIGLIRTNGINVFPINVFSVLMYLTFVILIIALRNKRCEDRLGLARVTLLLVICNALGVATIIMCLSRYMIYNMSLFYFALLLMIESILKREKK